MAAAKPKTGSKSDSKQESPKSLIVAAIDFGTTFTGFAYSFRRSTLGEIFTSKWSGENVRVETDRTPTSVLLSPQREFVAFGYEAEDRYTEIIGSGEGNDYYFFERFKMKLYHTKKLRRETKLADIHGKEMLALDIFAIVIKHLKDKLETSIAQSSAGLQEDEILWMLPVPAIWSDSAKQFMKEAAEKAGISSDCLKIILEPEAGSLYCNTKPLCKKAKIDGTIQFEEFPEGQKYIVADIGGGTVDISVHEIIQNGNLRELYCSNGDAYGGTVVDTEFLKFLSDLFGEKVINYMTEHYYNRVLELRADFETKKRKFESDGVESIKIKIPTAALTDAVQNLNEEPIEVKAQKAYEKYGDQVQIKCDKLHIHPDIMANIFKKASLGVVDLIKKTHQEDELQEINTLLLVGGFSGSKYLQSMIREEIPGLRIIVPQDPSLAVLKGAVLFGLNPKIITERIARFSYGFSVMRAFIPGEDPEELKVSDGKQDYCAQVFRKLITKGDVLKVGDRFGVPAGHSCSKESLLEKYFPIFIDLYRSDQKDPKYTARGYGCECNGVVLMMPPTTGWSEASIVIQELVVGEAEFTVNGYDVATGVKVDGKIDFLAHRSSNSDDEPNGVQIEIHFEFRK